MEEAVGADVGVQVGQEPLLEVAVTQVAERMGFTTVRTSPEDI